MPSRLPGVRYERIKLAGGWDQVTPTYELPPGFLRDGANYEVATRGGYRRIAGYERFDGRAKPSDAVYEYVQFDAMSTVPAVGDVLIKEGEVSPKGNVVAVAEASSYVVLTNMTGSFSVGDAVDINSGSASPGTDVGTVVTPNIAISAKQHAQYLNNAADYYRTLIGAVPGSGAVLGVSTLMVGTTDNTFAFRKRDGADFVDVYKSSASGWTAVTLFNEISFSAAGAGVPADGDTLTQGGVTATIKRVVLESGSYAASSAAGRFIIGTPAGGAFASGAATAGSVGCTLAGAHTAITLAYDSTASPPQHFSFITSNFSGTLASECLYGADGVNRAFEFDGTVLVPIVATTPSSDDTPRYLAELKNHLFLSIGSSMFFSGPGLPYEFSAAVGGGEIAIGDTISGFKVQPGEQGNAAMGVFSRNNLRMLYGTGTADWNLVIYISFTGAQHYSVDAMSETYFLDDRGVMSLRTAMTYGNFEDATLSHSIQPFIDAHQGSVVSSLVHRGKSQYRLLFDDGSGVYMTIVNGEYLGAIQVQYEDRMYCTFSGERANGEEAVFMGAEATGYVYEADKGTSFDGASVDSFMDLVWDPAGFPRMIKRYRKMALEVGSDTYAEVGATYKVGYGDAKYVQPMGVPRTYELGFGGDTWDQFSWDGFTWDSHGLGEIEMDMAGSGNNVMVQLSSSTDYIAPYTVDSVSLHYSLRRGVR